MNRFIFIFFLIISAVSWSDDLFLPDLCKQAELHNPQLLAASMDVKTAEEAVHLAQLGWVPQVSVGFGYGYNTSQPSQQNSATSWSLGFGEVISNGPKVQIAKNNLDKAKHAYETTKNDIFNKIAVAYEEYVLHKKNIEIGQSAYEGSLANMEIVKKYFANANIQPSEVLKSQEIVTNFERAVQAEQAQLKIIEHELDTLVGKGR